MPENTSSREPVRPTQSYADYNRFAWLYDREWGLIGSGLFEVMYKVSGRMIPPQARILDLCCGTGQLAKLLSERGYQVTGLDGSEEMLALAKKNAPTAEFILADARSFRLPPVFAAVISTYDSLNHLMTASHLRTVFQNVFDCLTPKGVFAFDLNALKGYQTQWQDYLEVVERDSYFYVNQGDYDPGTRTGETHCTIFHYLHNSWQCSDIKLYQKYHPPDRVQSLLQKAGFVRIRQYGVSQKQAVHKFTPKDTRVFFVCRKP